MEDPASVVNTTTLRPPTAIGGTTSYKKDATPSSFNTDSPVTFASVLFNNVTNVNKNNRVNYQSGINEFGIGGFVRPESNPVLTKDKATQTNTEEHTSLGFASNLSPIIDSTLSENKETKAAFTVSPNATNSISMLYTLFKDVKMERKDTKDTKLFGTTAIMINPRTTATTSKPLAKYIAQTTALRGPKILNKTVSNQDKIVTEQFENYRSLKQMANFSKSQRSPKPELERKSVTKQKSSPNSTSEPQLSSANTILRSESFTLTTLDTLISPTNKNFQTHFPFFFTEQANDFDKSEPPDSPSTAETEHSQGNLFQTPTTGIPSLSSFPTTTPIQSQDQTSLEDKSDFEQPIADTTTQSWPEIHPPIAPLSEQQKLVTSQTSRSLPLTSKLARIFTPDKDIQDLSSFSATTDVLSLGEAAQSLVTQSTKSPSTYSLVSSNIVHQSHTTSSKDLVSTNPSMVHSSTISASKLQNYFTSVSYNTTPGSTNPLLNPSLTSEPTIGPTNPLLIPNLYYAAFISHPKSVTTSPSNVFPSESPILFPTNPDSIHLSTILSTHSQHRSTDSIADTPTVHTSPPSTLFPSIYTSNFHNKATTVSKDTTTDPASQHLINSSPIFQQGPIHSSKGTTIIPTIHTIFAYSSGHRSSSLSKGSTLLQTSPLVIHSPNSHYRTSTPYEDSSTSLTSLSSVHSSTFRHRSTSFEGRTAQTDPLLINSSSVFTTSFHHRPTISSKGMSVVPPRQSFSQFTSVYTQTIHHKATTDSKVTTVVSTSPLSIHSSDTSSNGMATFPTNPSPIFSSAHRSSTASKSTTTVTTRPLSIWSSFTTSSKDTELLYKPSSITNSSISASKLKHKSNTTLKDTTIVPRSSIGGTNSQRSATYSEGMSIFTTSPPSAQFSPKVSSFHDKATTASKVTITTPPSPLSSHLPTILASNFYHRPATFFNDHKSASSIHSSISDSSFGHRSTTALKGRTTVQRRNQAFTFAATNFYNRLATSFKGTTIVPTSSSSFLVRFSLKSNGTSPLMIHASTVSATSSHQTSATEARTSIDPTSLSANRSLISSSRTSHGSNLASKRETTDQTRQFSLSTDPPNIFYQRSATEGSTSKVQTSQSTIPFPFSVSNTGLRSNLIQKGKPVDPTRPFDSPSIAHIIFHQRSATNYNNYNNIHKPSIATKGTNIVQTTPHKSSIIAATTSFEGTTITPKRPANLSFFSAVKTASSPISKGITNDLSIFNSSINSHQRSATKGLRLTIKNSFIFPTRKSTIQSFSTSNTQTRTSIVFTNSQAVGTLIPANSPITVTTPSKSTSSYPINPTNGDFSFTITHQKSTTASKDTNLAQTNFSLFHSSTNNYHPTSINTSKDSTIIPTSPRPVPSSSITATNSQYSSSNAFHISTNLAKGAAYQHYSPTSGSLKNTTMTIAKFPTLPSPPPISSIKTPSTLFNHRPSAARRSFFNPITSTLPESKQSLVPKQKNHDAKPSLSVSRSVIAQNTDQNHKIGNKPNVETKAKLPPNPPPDRNGKYPDIVPRHSAWELGMLLGSSAGLGMVLVVGVRYVYRQACGKRTEVTLPDREREYSRGERGLIHVQECGDLVRVRRIRENSFVLLAEYDILATPGD